MKAIAINGSPNKEGNTFHALSMVGNELKAADIKFEILHIGHKMVHGCIACGKCAINKDEKCSIKSDDLNDLIQQVKQAEHYPWLACLLFGRTGYDEKFVGPYVLCRRIEWEFISS